MRQTTCALIRRGVIGAFLLSAALLLRGKQVPGTIMPPSIRISEDAPDGAVAGGSFDVAAADLTCCEAPSTSEALCRDLEERILKSTARITIEAWRVKPGDAGYSLCCSMGHATVVEGHILITHNHFHLPIDLRTYEGNVTPYALIYLYDSAGKLVHKGPLSEFEVIFEDDETLMLAHREEGFLEELGFESAEFSTWDELSLEAGMEVADVDWDGNSTHVDWTTVLDVEFEDGAPRLDLANRTLEGASGGGVFWHGIHVANNWRVEEKIGANGGIIEAITAGAMNPPEVLTCSP